MDRYSSSSPGTLIGIVRELACSNLAHVFLCNAVEVGVDTPEAEESVTRLEQLAHESQKYISHNCVFVPDVYLGIYCRLRRQDEWARALFRRSLQRSVQILPNGNPTIYNLSELLYTLSRAGDSKNVVSIASKSEEEGINPRYMCCGPCRRKIPTRNGSSICPICLEQLCPDCVKIEEGVMPKKRCISQHVEYFISIPPQIGEISGGGILVDVEELEFKA